MAASSSVTNPTFLFTASDAKIYRVVVTAAASDGDDKEASSASSSPTLHFSAEALEEWHCPSDATGIGAELEEWRGAQWRGGIGNALSHASLIRLFFDAYCVVAEAVDSFNVVNALASGYSRNNLRRWAPE